MMNPKGRRLPATFFKFGIISALSFGIDFFIFILLHAFMQQVFMPLLIARLISSTFNFWQNKRFVYRAHQSYRTRHELLQYLILAIAVFFSAYISIKYLIQHLYWPVIVAKLLVDMIIFVFVYFVQKYIIFRRKNSVS